MAIHASELLEICESVRPPSNLVGDIEHLADQALSDGQPIEVVTNTSKVDLRMLHDNLKDYGFNADQVSGSGVTKIWRDPRNKNEVSASRLIQIIKDSGATTATIGEVNLLGYATEPGASQ